MAAEGPGALGSFSAFLAFAALLGFWLFTSSGSVSVGTVWFTFSAALSVGSCYTRPAALVIKADAERITALMPPLFWVITVDLEWKYHFQFCVLFWTWGYFAFSLFEEHFSVKVHMCKQKFCIFWMKFQIPPKWVAHFTGDLHLTSATH